MELKHTVALMNSDDYKERFKAEYYQTKERYEKLKGFNTKIEAANLLLDGIKNAEPIVKEPEHDCPYELLRRQQAIMGEYLHILELRASIENIIV